jgi:hypothetical protein
MKRTWLGFGFLVALLLSGTAANAQAQPRAAPPDGQGHVQPQELRERRQHRRARMKARLVTRFDRNGDGQLTGREKRAAKRFLKRIRRGGGGGGRWQGDRGAPD